MMLPNPLELQIVGKVYEKQFPHVQMGEDSVDEGVEGESGERPLKWGLETLVDCVVICELEEAVK